MHLYIDKQNVKSIAQSKSHPNFEECIRLAKGNFSIQYNFEKNQDLLNDPELLFWFRLFGAEGRPKGCNDTFCPPMEVFPPRPLKSNFYNSFEKEAITSVYLIDDDENKCDTIINKHCILLGKVGQEIEVLSSILLQNTEKIMSSLTSWADYLPELPLSDIVICDNHYFKNKQVYDNNKNELISALTRIVQDSPINLVIIVKEGEVDNTIDLAQEKNNIQKWLRDNTSRKSTVSIFTTYATHDRNVITNYTRIKPGACVHLKDNGLKNDVTVEIKTHANRTNEDVSNSLLKTYGDIANNPVNAFTDEDFKCNLF